MKTALYLDDSVTSHRLMERFLQGVCIVKAARNSAEALQVLRQEPVDLIIADYLLPGESGLDFIIHAKKEFALDAVPSLLVSGSMDKLLISQAVRNKINDCVCKPLQKDVVAAVVSKMLAEPYFRKIDSVTVNVVCIEWAQDGRFFQYCPELRHTEEAPDVKTAAVQMQLYLESRFAAGTDLGAVTVAHATSHVVEKKVLPQGESAS